MDEMYELLRDTPRFGKGYKASKANFINTFNLVDVKTFEECIKKGWFSKINKENKRAHSNKEKIEVLLRIYEYWTVFSDLRLLQLLEVAIKHKDRERDLFYMEDYEVLNFLDKFKKFNDKQDNEKKLLEIGDRLIIKLNE